MPSAWPAQVKPGGYVYLDNTDADLDTEQGEMRRAEQMLVDAARAAGGSVQYFTDFAPITFFAEQGMLAHLVQRS